MPLYRKKNNAGTSAILTQKEVGSKKIDFKSPLLANQIKLYSQITNKKSDVLPKQKENRSWTEECVNSSNSTTESQFAKGIPSSNRSSQAIEELIHGIIKKTPEKRSKYAVNQKPKKTANTDDLDSTIESLWSQSVVPEKMSDPPEHFTHYERLVWLREQRNVGLYVLCDDCNKFRYLKDVKDPLELPEMWYCPMNPDKRFNRCSVPEEQLSPYDEDEMIHNLYHAGSVVWAKLDGYPWWPAIVDDDPDTEQYYWLNEFSDSPTYYHVVFFDSQCVSRAWLKPTEIHKFQDFENNRMFKLKNGQLCYQKRVDFAKIQASKALKYKLPERLDIYGFLARWPHKIIKPIDKRNSKSEKKEKLSKTKKSKDKKKGKLSLSNVVKKDNRKKIMRIYSSSMYSDCSTPDLFANKDDSHLIHDIMNGMDCDNIN